MRPLFIAEVKTQSPFGFRSKYTWEGLLEIAVEYGGMVAIHTDPRWGGSFNLVARARRITEKLILAKGIHASNDDIKRAVDAGADAVLVVGRAPDIHPDRCWLEPRFLIDLQGYPPGTKAVWNSRDLRDGSKKHEPWERARAGWRGWLCQASNIRTLADVHPDADAFLVGEHMVTVAKELTITN